MTLVERHGSRRAGWWRAAGRLRPPGSLERNSLWLMVATLLTSGVGYLYWIVAARSFDAADVGVAGGVISLTTIGAIVANLGTAPALVRHLPGLDDVEAWSRALSASLVGGALLGAGGGVAVLVVLPGLSDTLAETCRTPTVGVAVVVGMAAWVVGMALDYAFIAQRRGRLVAERGAFMGVVKLVLLVVPVLIISRATDSPTAIVISWSCSAVAAAAVGVLLMVPRAKPGFRLRLRGSWGELRPRRSMLLGNHLITLGNTLAPYLLPVVIVARRSAEDNAYFYATWMVGGVFFMISSAIGSSLFAEGVHDRAGLRRSLAAGARFTALLLLPTMVLVLIAAPQILSLFGSDYAEHGTALLRILTLAAIPDAVTNLYVAVLRTEDRLVAGAGLTMGMSVAALAGAWILAPGSSLMMIGVVWLLAQTAGSAWVLWDLTSRSGGGDLGERRQLGGEARDVVGQGDRVGEGGLGAR